MRDHRADALVRAPELIEITRQVREHATRHPGSVKRSPNRAKTASASRKKRAKIAAASRKVNRR